MVSLQVRSSVLSLVDSPLWPGFDHRKISDYKWRIDKSWSFYVLFIAASAAGGGVLFTVVSLQVRSSVLSLQWTVHFGLALIIEKSVTTSGGSTNHGHSGF